MPARSGHGFRTDPREMNPSWIITFAGFTGTIREWAQRQGMRAPTLESRINRGMSLARALTMPVQRHKHVKPPRIIAYKGKRATIAQWATEIGLAEAGLRSRLYRSRTIEEALTEPVHRMPDRLRKQVPLEVTSTAVKCFYCERTASTLHFLKTGIFRGVPLCGSPECINPEGGT